MLYLVPHKLHQSFISRKLFRNFPILGATSLGPPIVFSIFVPENFLLRITNKRSSCITKDALLLPKSLSLVPIHRRFDDIQFACLNRIIYYRIDIE